MPLLLIEELAEQMRTTPMALYCRRSRDPYSIPPVVKVPGDTRLFFDADVVDEWLRDPQSFLPEDRRPKRSAGRPRKSDPYTPKPLPSPVPKSKKSTPAKRGPRKDVPGDDGNEIGGKE